MNQHLKIQILVDDPESWIIPYALELNNMFTSFGYQSELIHDHINMKKNDALFILGCKKIISKELLALSKKNVLVHESNLPKGRGWAPLTYQILEGKNNIVFSLIEARDGVDSGEIYLQENLELEGHELCDEIRDAQGKLSVKMCWDFLSQIDLLSAKLQVGDATYYKKRNPKDSELDINKSIKDQFNLLRTCDNERYPAYFIINGQKYSIKIYKN